ncbi:MAG: substrate-binding domain-containing protein [Lachnospiraceae bacterium]|nr:substrate-binding domain-containing protein [Lachnospiraceae bacterium]
MKMKKLTAVLALVVLGALVSVGCGNNVKSDFDETMFISVISREEGSGTRGAFVEITGILEDDMDRTTLEAVIANGTSIVMTHVAEDVYAIGYISIGALNDTIKAVNINGVAATEANTKAGDYLISRPFHIVSQAAGNEAAIDFKNFIMSAEGQEVVTDAGLVAVPNLPHFESTNPSGRVVVGGSTSVAPVMERLAEAYYEQNPGVMIEIQSAGSSAGMTGVLDGNFDIGMASRDLSQSELDSGLVPTVMALDGIAVIVHPDNPITNLTLEQVDAIFTGEAITWDEVLHQ